MIEDMGICNGHNGDNKVQQTVVIGADHGGFALKEELKGHIAALGFAVLDVGTHSAERCDAADFAVKVAEGVRGGKAQFGVVICRTGQITAMACNRFPGIRCALVCNSTVARLARQHNNANVLSLGADITGAAVARDCVEAFLTTAFLDEARYTRRNEQLDTLI